MNLKICVSYTVSYEFYKVLVWFWSISWSGPFTVETFLLQAQPEVGWEETGLLLAFPGSICLILPTKNIIYDDVGHWGRTERRYYLNWSENGAAPNSKKFLNCTKKHHSPWQVSRIRGRCQVNPTKTPALFPLVWAPKLPGAARSLMGESKNGLLTSS